MEAKKRVLIVDDETFIRVLLVQAMEDIKRQGVEVLTAANGEEALEIVQRQPPDLIFLDVMMPTLNGYQVCQRVKEMYGDVYVIMLTAKGQLIDKERGEAMGADEYITKPFDPDYLIRRAAQVLDLDMVF
ncbi:MAG: response regulator transcription factor [Anaerolineae bacterium]